MQDILCSHFLPELVAVSTIVKLSLQYRCYLLFLQGLWVVNAVVCALNRFDPFMFASHFLWDG